MKKKEKKYSDTIKEVEEKNRNLHGKDKLYVSRTKLGFCKNEGCDNKRRHGSAFCGKCTS